MRRTWMSGVALAVCCALASTALADGVWLDGISARSLGRGGTNQGFADNGGILFDNPAAMTNIKGNTLFEGDFVGLETHFRYQDATRNSVASNFTPLPQIALIKRTADGNFAYGVGMFVPAGFATTYNTTGPAAFPGDRSYDSFGALAKILPGVSYKVTDRLSVGGTLGVGVSYASLLGPYFLQSAPLTGTPIILDIHGGGATMVWSAGVQYLLTDDTTIGATYQSASDFNLRGSAQVDLPPFLGGIGTRYDSTIHLRWPQSVALGMKHSLCPHRTVSADAIWYDWANAFNSIQVTMVNPSNPLFPPTIVDRLPLDWRSSVSMRLGYEQILDIGGTARIGYVYHPNPIPQATLTPFLPAFLTNTFTVGYGFSMKKWDLDIAWAHAFSSPQTVGTSAIVGGDFSNSRMKAQADAIMIGAKRQF